MAYRKKSYRRKKLYRKKKTFKKKSYRKKGNKWSRKVYSYISTVTAASVLQQTNLTAAVASFYFRESALLNVSAYATLYDEYKINKVKVTFYPNWTVSTPLDSQQDTSLIHTVIDYDDSNPLPSLNTAQTYSTYQCHSLKKIFIRTIYPKVAVPIYTDTTQLYTSIGTMPKPSTWIDLANPTVPHYGLKVWIDPNDSPTGLNQEWRVLVKYWVSYRLVR